jgi:hypothetical protein
VVCCISLLILAWQIARERPWHRKSIHHDEPQFIVSEGDEGELSARPIHEPQTVGWRISIQVITIIGLVITNAIPPALKAYRPGQHWTLFTGLGTWLYVLALAILQLVLPISHRRMLKLWSHMTAIYAFQWLLNFILFWSTSLHSKPKLSQIPTIVELILTSLLFLIAGTTGNGDALSSEAEGDLEPW